MIYYQEVFRTIQGEGYDSGEPVTFIRLFGCNLKCVYCDQPQAKEDRKKTSVTKLVDKVRKFSLTGNVCITGGEPLLQEEVYPLIYELVNLGYKVSIETNGAILLPNYEEKNRSYKYIMDVKCPSSGASHYNKFENLEILQAKDEVKFVIGDRNDYEYAKKVLKKYPTKAKLLFSPMFDENNKTHIGQDLCNWLIEDNFNYGNFKVQIQIHKIIGVK